MIWSFSAGRRSNPQKQPDSELDLETVDNYDSYLNINLPRIIHARTKVISAQESTNI